MDNNCTKSNDFKILNIILYSKGRCIRRTLERDIIFSCTLSIDH